MSVAQVPAGCGGSRDGGGICRSRQCPHRPHPGSGASVAAAPPNWSHIRSSGAVRLADHSADARVALQHRLHRLECLGHRRRGLIAARHPHSVRRNPRSCSCSVRSSTSSQSCWPADQSSPKATASHGVTSRRLIWPRSCKAAHELRVPPVGVRPGQGAGRTGSAGR